MGSFHGFSQYLVDPGTFLAVGTLEPLDSQSIGTLQKVSASDIPCDLVPWCYRLYACCQFQRSGWSSASNQSRERNWGIICALLLSDVLNINDMIYAVFIDI